MIGKIGYYITYYAVYTWMLAHALMPLKLLYVLSDILYFFVYKLVGYRLKVVRKNLSDSFPEKTQEELIIIEKRFYHHFCDYFVETIKLLHISDKEAYERIKFTNIEVVKDLMKDGRSGLMYLGHYGNWEWVPSITRFFQDGEELGQIYRPLKNKAFDDLFIKIRSRFGSFGIAKNDTLRTILKLKNEGQQVLIGFMSDQTPSASNIHYWTNFLNHDTPVFTGVERIAKKTNFSVTYLDVAKVGRGYYECTVKVISDLPKEEPLFAITERYMREMEKTILRDPAFWLWTHKRWKYDRNRVAAHNANMHKTHE